MRYQKPSIAILGLLFSAGLLSGHQLSEKQGTGAGQRALFGIVQNTQEPTTGSESSDNSESETQNTEAVSLEGETAAGEASEAESSESSTETQNNTEGNTQDNPENQENNEQDSTGFEDSYDDNSAFLDDEPAEQKLEISDPLEFINRPIHKFNHFFLTYLMRPAAIGYDFVVPKFIRLGLSNFADNIHMPVRLINSSLQGKFAGAGRELGRFGINTSVGLAGLFDPAKGWFDIDPSNESFDQTLGVWGLEPGIYLNLPFLGPSNTRDLSGFTVDLFLKPEPWVLGYAVFPEEPGYATLAGMGAYTFFWLNDFSMDPNQYHDLIDGAIDDYTLLRDVFYQYQRRKVEE